MIIRSRTRVRRPRRYRPKRWHPRSGAGRWLPHGVLALALVAVAVIPAPSSVSEQQPTSCQTASCAAHTAAAVVWSRALPGTWSAENGVAGTVPVTGDAHAAVGNGVAVLATGLTVDAYSESTGDPRWSLALAGVPATSSVAAVDSWPGVVSVGVVTPRGDRTEVIVNAQTGAVLRQYPAARYGGAVLASLASTVIVGSRAVTSYDNQTGKVRWRLSSGARQQAWSTDGDLLVMSVSAGGYLGLAPVTALRVIDLIYGTERTFLPTSGTSFPGRLSGAAEGVVLFSDGSGVTAYSEDTGFPLWRAPGVPEGDDPQQHTIYLTEGTSLVGVDPRDGRMLTTVSGSGSGAAAGMYIVRGGVALGLDQGAGGSAWGYDISARRITWTLTGLGFPHFFTDLSDLSGLGGLGGSPAVDGGLVLIAACTKAVSPSASPTPSVSGSGSAPASSSPTASPSASPSGSASASASPTPAATPPESCAHPELVAFSL